MKVKSVEIKNFRSIREESVVFEEVGGRTCLILLGKNESGKSNFLKAISLLDQANLDSVDYAVDCHKAAETKGEAIEIRYHLDLSRFNFYTKEFAKDGMHADLVACIKAKEIYRYILVEKGNKKENYVWIDLEDNGDFSKFAINGEQIKLVSELYSGTDPLTEETAPQLLGEGWKLLGRISLEEYLQNKYYDLINSCIPKTVYWTYNEKYLINQVVDLATFKDDHQICVPLRNVFFIAGIEDIKERIELISTSKEKRKQLEDELSAGITTYINGAWKEHEINIKVDIESMQCSIMIEDKDNAVPKYSMDQRSDGFKQFISILLNISAENRTSKLKDKIILLDEPEVHLHPSGVRYLRDELLNIAKNNVVVIATHSIFMIDKKNLDRHYGVQKEGSVTTIERLSEENPYQDEVVYEALGTSIYELIQENMIVFEGKTDRDLFNAFTKKYSAEIKPENVGTISADSVTKIQNYTKFFNQKLVKGFVVVDSDGDGQAAKKRILGEIGFSDKNVFEISDLATVPGGATMEDLLPKEVIIESIKKQWNLVIEIDANQPVMKQLDSKNKELKGCLDPDEVKVAILKSVLADLKKMNKDNCKKKYKKYFDFVDAVHKKIKVL